MSDLTDSRFGDDSRGGKKSRRVVGLDLTGQRFGRLTAIRPVNPGSGSWICKCDCGNEITVYASRLRCGSVRSCGCLYQESRGKISERLHQSDGTCLERLIRAKNTTGLNQCGFRGLYYTKSGKYRASISFQKKHYTLGYFDTKIDAARARMDAERVLHDGYIEAFQKYQKWAEQNPDEAKQNPFHYKVSRVNGEFVTTANLVL